MKYLNLIFGTILSWFDNRAFSFVFAMLLSIVAFFGADPIPGIPVANVAVLAFFVGLLTTAVLLAGSCIVLKKTYNWAAAGCALVGTLVGVLLALTANTWLCVI